MGDGRGINGRRAICIRTSVSTRVAAHAIRDPGGCIDPEDKDPEEAIARELLEETGYRFSSYKYLGRTSANPSTNSNWMHFYLATGGVLTREQQLDDNEDIEIHLFTLDEVKELLRSNQIIQSMHCTALFYALAELGALKY